jgi:hypothetical protein
MSRSGQTARDYGVHTVPATNWVEYGPCGCGAQAGLPCWDRRMKHVPVQETWTPHPERQFYGQPGPGQ